MYQTDDLVYWPVLRWAEEKFLRSVERFYVYNQGRSALLMTRDVKCYVVIGDNSGQSSDNIEHQAIAELVELRGKSVVHCASGCGFVMVLTSDADLYGWGVNVCGQIGVGSEENLVKRPTLVMRSVQKVACGTNHCAALRLDATLWCWGDNAHGQLGFAHPSMRFNPVQVLDQEQVTLLDCGRYFCVALTYDRIDQSRLYHWGSFYTDCTIANPTEITLPRGVTITRLICGYIDFLLLTAQGHFYHCFYVNHQQGFKSESNRKGKKLHCELHQQAERIEAIVYADVSSAGNLYGVKLQSGYVSMYRCICKHKVTPTRITSLPDACALYCFPPVTPGLTTLPAHAISQPLMRSISHFHDPSTADLVLWVEHKPIYLNKHIAAKLSPFLAKLIQGAWKDQGQVRLLSSAHWFVVWFTYLRYVLTDTLSVIEPDWACQLFSLANQCQAIELRDECRHLITTHLSQSDLVRLLQDFTQGHFVSHFLLTNLSVHNACYYYQLAVEAKDVALQERVVKAVTKFDLLSLIDTEGYRKTTGEHIKTLLSRIKQFHFSYSSHSLNSS